MNAQVIPFPRLLGPPVIQHPRRGRLPKAIGSLRQKRAEIAAAQAEADRERRGQVMRTHGQMLNVCDQALARQFVGAVVLGRTADGARTAFALGSCCDSLGLAVELLKESLPVVQSYAERQASNRGPEKTP